MGCRRSQPPSSPRKERRLRCRSRPVPPRRPAGRVEAGETRRRAPPTRVRRQRAPSARGPATPGLAPLRGQRATVPGNARGSTTARCVLAPRRREDHPSPPRKAAARPLGPTRPAWRKAGGLPVSARTGTRHKAGESQTARVAPGRRSPPARTRSCGCHPGAGRPPRARGIRSMAPRSRETGSGSNQASTRAPLPPRRPRRRGARPLRPPAGPRPWRRGPRPAGRQPARPRPTAPAECRRRSPTAGRTTW